MCIPGEYPCKDIDLKPLFGAFNRHPEHVVIVVIIFAAIFLALSWINDSEGNLK